MANISGLIPLDAFVRRLLGKEGKDDDNYLRYMQIACDALRHMHSHDFSVEVTKVVTVNASTNTFSWPTDYVRYIWIATPIDGRWWTYTRDDTMVPLSDDDSVAIQASLPNVAETGIISTMSEGGGQNKYYFRPDAKNRRFQVGGYTPDIVVLKYVTNGIDSTGNINIPDYAALAIEDYVRWKIADYDKEAQSEIMRLNSQYVLSRREMRQMHRPALSDIIDTLHSTLGVLRR